ncbi:hypothetical protein MJM83_30525, partial [Salmonella enterica subsp. enterica serovar Montevideo]|nr:hypothetical protein [Salmonella enterica subsp. enterica serovar Montevideo]
ERLLENITILAEAASLATSAALTDELVSHGELMSTLLFVEILLRSPQYVSVSFASAEISQNAITGKSTVCEAKGIFDAISPGIQR